jgi:hypothetical protein
MGKNITEKIGISYRSFFFFITIKATIPKTMTTAAVDA